MRHANCIAYLRQVYNKGVAHQKKRNLSAPITARDWFLHDLYNDPVFVDIRNNFIDELAVNDPVGLSALVGEPTSKVHVAITDQHVDKLCSTFQINDQTARRGLFITEYRYPWSRQRVPMAYIDGGDILIRIGPETRPEDVLRLWKLRIGDLQNELKPHRSKRDTEPKETSLAFVIHKHVIAGEKIADIYRDYSFNKLNDYTGATNINTVEDFRKYYNGIVKGFKNKD